MDMKHFNQCLNLLKSIKQTSHVFWFNLHVLFVDFSVYWRWVTVHPSHVDFLNTFECNHPRAHIRSDGELLTMHSLWEGSLVPLEYRSATLHLLSMLRHHLYGWLEWWLLPDRVDRWVCWSWFHCSSLEGGQWSLTKQNLQKVWTAKCSQQQKQKREKNENFDMAVSLLFFNLLGYAVFLKFFWCSLVEKPSQFL